MPKGNSPEKGDRFSDMFASYSPEKKGDLLEYLKSCDLNGVDNLFSGPEYFKKMVELGVVWPGVTTIRVNQSPAPDALYFVNEENLLESRGRGGYNMSAMAMEKGIWKPEEVLKGKQWSISGLRLWKNNEEYE